jgi:hypothetical protein
MNTWRFHKRLIYREFLRCFSAALLWCVAAAGRPAEPLGMAKTPSNRPAKSKSGRPDNSAERCVVVVLESPDSGGMKSRSANQPTKPKPSQHASVTRADVHIALARAKLTGAEAKKIQAIAALVGALTGLLYVVLPYVG